MAARTLKFKILRSASVGIKRGKVVRRRANISEGFHDSNGVFHPIRSAADYDPSRGDAGRAPKKKRAKKAKSAKAKAKPKARRRAAVAPKKKRRAKKGGRR